MADPTDPARTVRGWGLWPVWCVACLMVLVVGYVLGAGTRSVWADALDNADARPIATAVVENVTYTPPKAQLTGEVRLGATSEVIVHPGDGAATAVVTRATAEAGDHLQGGDVAAVVSGRPVILLELAFPLYRDLRPGDHGPDVAVVQESLAALGLYRGYVDGQFGAGTAAAVTGLYRSVGHEPPEVDEHIEQAVHDATAALETLVADGGTPEEQQEARNRLAEARAAAAPWLPARETHACGPGGVSVVAAAPTGTVLGLDTSAALTVRSHEPVAVLRAAVNDVDAFPEAQAVVVTPAHGGAAVSGEVHSVSEFRQGDDGDPPGYDITVALTDVTGLTDRERVIVTPDLTSDDVEGLAVPLTAVHEDADGTYLLTPRGDVLDARHAELERVDVQVGPQVDGKVMVTGDQIRPGLVVVVGGTG